MKQSLFRIWFSPYQRGKVTEEKSPEFWQLGIQSLSPTYGEGMRLHIDTVFVLRLFNKTFCDDWAPANDEQKFNVFSH